VEGRRKREDWRRETSGSGGNEHSQANEPLLVGADMVLWGQIRDPLDEGQDRLAGGKVCGASEHSRQVVSASGLFHEGSAKRLLLPEHIWWILAATNLHNPMKGWGRVGGGLG